MCKKTQVQRCARFYMPHVLELCFVFVDYSDLTHALVGKFSRDINDIEQAEEIEIERVYLHPNWDYDSARFDQMVIKLKNPSTKPYVNVNRQPSLPEPEVDTLTVIGVGRTRTARSMGTILSALSPTTWFVQFRELTKDSAMVTQVDHI
jgi:hypothetical protein